jgi:hypothetical protein
MGDRKQPVPVPRNAKRPAPPPKPPAKVSLTIERCLFFTNMPGFTCPVCREAIKPNVQHTCERAG